MQSQIRMQIAWGSAFEMVAKVGVVMRYVKRSMTRRRMDHWRVVRVLQPAVPEEEWVVQVYLIATKEESLSRI